MADFAFWTWMWEGSRWLLTGIVAAICIVGAALFVGFLIVLWRMWRGN